MTELEGVESGSQGSRRRLRGAGLWLRLLDGLGLVSWALLVSTSSSTIPSATATSSLTITLLLFEGWLVRSAVDSAQPLSLVARSLSSFPLFPGKTNGLAHVFDVQRFDPLSLAEELGEPIERAQEFGHDQHHLEVIRYLKPRCITSGEVSRHFVDGNSGVFLVTDLNVHGRFELEVGCDDTRLPVMFLKVGPK